MEQLPPVPQGWYFLSDFELPLRMGATNEPDDPHLLSFCHQFTLFHLGSAPTLVRISGLRSGSGLFWQSGPDFAEKSGFFMKLWKERLNYHILVCVGSIILYGNVSLKR